MAAAARLPYHPGMTKNLLLPAGLVAGLALSSVLAGCTASVSGQAGGHRGHRTGPTQAVVVFQDDYDYYPGYEVYYSRSRREYVYLDGNVWVRRPEPRGITLSVLLAAPSVRVDFRDSPEHHHAMVLQNYPKNWQPPGKTKTDQKHHAEDKKPDKKKKGKKDQDEERKDDHRKN